MIEIDEVFSLAEKYVTMTGTSVFLTGKAGTGKTTFLKYITDSVSKRFVVLAPTGVAAINAGGSTIHSFFQLPLCPYLPDVKELLTEYQMPERFQTLRKERIKIIRTLELLIIDEISMVRADLLDAVDMTLRRYRRNDKPFGGVQLLMIGDAQQLSPVVKDDERKYLEQVYPSPYFFHSKALRKLHYVTIELNKVHRQKDAEFLEILNAVRENRITPEMLSKLNRRVGAPVPDLGGREPIRLTTHNRQANEINTRKLAALEGESRIFHAEVEGDFPERNYPAEEELELKPGAQVMFIRNDSEGEYYNGKLARVEDISPEGVVTVSDEDGRMIVVQRAEWPNTQYSLNDESGEIEQTVLGTFRQLPLRTAWAITIHKSQGLTFDNVIIDAGMAFAFGQVYVALSRCRSLEGIILDTPVRVGNIYQDLDVEQFNNSRSSLSDVRQGLELEERHYRYEVLCGLFDYSPACSATARLLSAMRQNLSKTYPTQIESLSKCLDSLREPEKVAGTFRGQLAAIFRKPELDESFLSERLAKAASYFIPFSEQAATSITTTLGLEIDNKETKKKVSELTEDALGILEVQIKAFKMIAERGFSMKEYASIRTENELEDSRKAKARRLKRIARSPEDADSTVNEGLLEALQAWRSAKFKEENVPAYRILPQKTVLEIAAFAPSTMEELLSINGIGKEKAQRYGTELLEIVAGFKDPS